MSIQVRQQRKPRLRVTEADYDALTDLADVMRGDGAALLREELDRADIVRNERGTPFHVRLGSWVEYRDRVSGRVRRIQLTLPKDADIDAGRLSVATPTGAALLGLRVGDTFNWTRGDARLCSVIVEGVAQGGACEGEAA